MIFVPTIFSFRSWRLNRHIIMHKLSFILFWEDLRYSERQFWVIFPFIWQPLTAIGFKTSLKCSISCQNKKSTQKTSRLVAIENFFWECIKQRSEPILYWLNGDVCKAERGEKVVFADILDVLVCKKAELSTGTESVPRTRHEHTRVYRPLI